MAGSLINRRHALVLSLLFMSLATGCRAEEAISGIDADPAQWQVDDVPPIMTGSAIRVAAGEDFQAALNSAKPGDVIELESGAIFTGPFILPSKAASRGADSRWVLIRSAAPAGALPQDGSRVDPSHAMHMATLQAASGPVLSAAPAAHHYRFEGIRIRPATNGATLKSKLANWARKAASGVEGGIAGSSDAPFLYNLIALGTDAESMEELPHHIIFDRCYIHGDPVVGARRGIALNSRHTAIINSYLEDFKEVGFDSQAIAGWNGPGPFKIVNNYLEAAGENVMFGGAIPRIEGLVPSDIEIRGNYFSKPLSWNIHDAGYEGTPWTVKNLLELKNARRVIIEGNLFEYNWPHAQNGFAILFTVRNEDGAVPWATVSDVQFSSNVVRHVANGINILGLDDNRHPSRISTGVLIDNNLFLSVGGSWGGGTLFQLLKSTEQVVISRNTADQAGSIIVTDGEGVHASFRFVGNVMPHNTYGIIGSGAAPGLGTIQRDFPGSEITGNVIIGADASRYPERNEFPGSLDVPDTLKAPERTDRSIQDDLAAGVDITRLCSALDAANPSPASELAYCQ